MIDLLSGSFVAQAIYVAAKLGIADRIAAGTLSAEAIARELDVDATTLSRVMRLLVAHDVFRRDDAGSSSAFLRAAAPHRPGEARQGSREGEYPSEAARSGYRIGQGDPPRSCGRMSSSTFEPGDHGGDPE